MDYEVYHDESKIGGYWHGILLIPVDKKKEMIEGLLDLRRFFEHEEPIGIKKVGSSGKVYNFAHSWINYGIASLIQNMKNGAYDFPVIRNKKLNKIISLNNAIGAKFILFKESDDHKKLEGYPDYASKIETTFRIGLKGGLHLLGSLENPIKIIKIHFDGNEHYQRNLDKKRIIDRINGLREYCSFDDGDIIDDRGSNHKLDNSQDYNDCQLLQLTDLLIGAFRTSYGYVTNEKQKCLSFGTDQLIEKYQAGYKRMSNSRWNKGFCMSQCKIISNGWQFSEITYENGYNSKINLTKPFDF
jgi:hypothetical protein